MCTPAGDGIIVQMPKHMADRPNLPMFEGERLWRAELEDDLPFKLPVEVGKEKLVPISAHNRAFRALWTFLCTIA